MLHSTAGRGEAKATPAKKRVAAGRKAEKFCPQSPLLDLGILLYCAHWPQRLPGSVIYQEHKVSGGIAHASTVLLLLHNLLITPLCQVTKIAVLRQHAILQHTFWGLVVIPFVTRKLLSTSSGRILPEQVGQWKGWLQTISSVSFCVLLGFHGRSWLFVSSQYALGFCSCAYYVSCLNCAGRKKSSKYYSSARI